MTPEIENISTVTPYKPKAIYFEHADSLEYVRSDIPAVHRRIDEFLTLIVSMDAREPMGFKLKGFKNIYLNYQQSQEGSVSRSKEFPKLVQILEQIMTEIGSSIFDDQGTKAAYREAIDIAASDMVTLTEVPSAA